MIDEARRFLQALTGQPNPEVTFQTFVDSGESSLAPIILHGRLDECWPRLEEAQDAGHGVFVMVNEGTGFGRSNEHVRALRALFADNDGDGLPGCVKLPNIVVRSGTGWHYYYLLKPAEPMTDFVLAQKAIAAKMRTDPKVCDLARVLRLPGTFNLKDRSSPKLVELLRSDREPLRSITGVLAYLNISQADLNAQRVPASASPPPASGDITLCSDAMSRAQGYIANITATARALGGNGRDLVCYKVAGALQKNFGLDDATAWNILKDWNRENCNPPLAEVELGKKWMNAKRYGKAPMAKRIAAVIKEATEDHVQDTVSEVATTNPRLDPENWVCDISLGRPWRFWREGAWSEGIAESGLTRILKNEGGLNKKQIDRWQERVPVVDEAAPVYSSRDRTAVRADGTRVANTFRWPVLQPAEGDWTPIRRILLNLVAGDVDSYLWFEGWLGRMVQGIYNGRPERLGTAVTCCGAKGAGKGVIEEVMKPIVGRYNVASISQGTLDSPHNGWLEGKLLVCADECWTSDSRAPSQIAALKNNITCHERTINPKGRDQYTRTAVENWLIFSNSFRPVEVESGDRRLTIFRTGGPIPVELGAQVADDARADGPIVRAFLHHLLSLRPEELVGQYRPLNTAAKEEVARASGNSATKFAEDVKGRGFWSLTGAWSQNGLGKGPQDLYLAGPKGLRCIEGVDGPVLLNRKLLDVYRAYAQEIGAPAQQEATLLAALREVLPGLTEATLSVEGRTEKVIAGLPGMLPEFQNVIVAPPEAPLPTQKTLF